MLKRLDEHQSTPQIAYFLLYLCFFIEAKVAKLDCTPILEN